MISPKKPKKKLWKSQNGTCAGCGEAKEIMELDHKKRVCDGGDNDIKNLQYLCPECHTDKTAEEMNMKDVPITTHWESSMIGDVLEVVMECPGPQNLIHGDGTDSCLAMDNVRSRFNGVIQPNWPFPKIGILDTLIPYDEYIEMRGEYQILIDAGQGIAESKFDFVNYQKAMLYPYERAKFIIENEVFSEQGQITKDHFKAILIPSESIDKEQRNKVINTMLDEIKHAIEQVKVERFMSRKDQFSEENTFMKKYFGHGNSMLKFQKMILSKN